MNVPSEIVDVLRAWYKARDKGDAAAISRLYVDRTGTVLLPNGVTLTGRSDIECHYTQTLSSTQHNPALNNYSLQHVYHSGLIAHVISSARSKSTNVAYSFVDILLFNDDLKRWEIAFSSWTITESQ
jgi:ketosteroid isomerase-like protein